MRHPISGLVYYFIDKCLPFGSSISCALFQKFSDCLNFLGQWRIRLTLLVEPEITNYLDDFLLMAVTLLLCNNMMRVFLEVCDELKCPMSPDKTEWATDLIIFLGILLNGQMQVLSVPEDKNQKAIHLIKEMLGARTATIKNIQKLTGTLNFLNRAIVPGHAFTRGMYQKLKIIDSHGVLLKQHHHVSINSDFKRDCETWLQFLQSPDLRICRPYIDFLDESNQILNFYSDASKNSSLGMGAVYGNRWLVAQWD